MNLKTGKTGVTALLIAGLFCMSVLISSCGGGGGGTHATSAARVTGQVLAQNTGLARINGITAERTASQAAGCAAPPTGYVAISGATVAVSGSDVTATTDSNGCFSFDATLSGVVVFTATKTNAAGGTTTLKKAANLTPNTNTNFVATDGITELSTVAAMIIEQKIANNESNIDPDATETYVEAIQEQENIQQLMTSIVSSAGDPNADGFTSFENIDTTTLTAGEQTTDKPVIWSASVSGSPVASTGGAATISAKAAAYGTGNSITTLVASLIPESGSAIEVTMTADSTTANLYTGTYTFGENTMTVSVDYGLSFSATDAGGATNTYRPTSVTVTQLAAGQTTQTTPVCGNSTTETGEQCDDGNTTDGDGCSSTCQTETAPTCGNGTLDAGENCEMGTANATTCTPIVHDSGQSASCSYCDSTTCQFYTITWECGDGELQTAIGEQCDDGDSNTDTGCTADYGGSCNYCDTSCQTQTTQGGSCGDGTLDAGSSEQCDDGNTDSNDGCSSTCQNEWRTIQTISGSGSNTFAGYSVASAGDVDGDGKAEIIVGAYNVSSVGRAYLYDDDGTTVLGTINGTSMFDNLGTCVASAGDVDGDGKAELIIGAPGADPGGNSGAGSAYLYDDDASTVLATINGLGAGDDLGHSVASAGDVDGDGKAELIIGARGTNSTNGAAYLYDDDGTTLIQTLDDGVGFSKFGSSVASAGDVDGDGKAELFIGAPYTSSGGLDYNGAAYLYDDDGTTVLATINGSESFGYLGTSVASAGDVDGDGKAEFLVGAPSAGTGGIAYLYDDDGTTVLATMNGAAASDSFGYSVASAGDIDGDGKAEILIGAYYADPAGNSDAGSAYLYDDDGTTLLWTYNGTATSDQFGFSVASVGDVDGDGKAEIIVGAPFADPGGYNNAGSAYLYDK